MNLLKKHTALWLLSLLTLIAVSAALLLAPAHYLAIDVNPSIELETNWLNRVTKVTAANADARKMLDGVDLTGETLEDAVEKIMNLLMKSGYITGGTDNKVLVTVDDGYADSQAVRQVNQTIAQLLKSKQIEAQILNNQVSDLKKLQTEAEKYHISAGKYELIQQMMKDDDSLSLEQLASLRVSDLTAFAVQKDIKLNRVLGQFEDAVENTLDRCNDSNDNQHSNNWYDDDRYDDRYDDDRYEKDDDDWYDDDRYEKDDDDRYDDDRYEDDDDDWYDDDRYEKDDDDRYDDDRYEDDDDDRYDDDRYEKDDDDRYDDDRWDD